MAQETLTIGGLAKVAGVNVETVRYYQRIKLMPVPKKQPGGIRRYGEPELQRLRFVKTAQALGFSLDEVADLVKLDDGMHCAEARTIAEQKLELVRARLADLRRIESTLAGFVRECRFRRGNVVCPLIDSIKRR